MKKALVTALAAGIFYIVAFGSANGANVSIDLSGTVYFSSNHDKNNVLADLGLVSGVSQLTGSIRYDTNTIPSYTYADGTNSLSQYYGINYSYSIDNVFTFTDDGSIAIRDNYLYSGSVRDWFQTSNYRQVVPETGLSFNSLLYWNDKAGTAWDTTDLPDAQAFNSMDLNSYFGRIYAGGWMSQGGYEWDMTVSNLRYSATQTPIPGAFLLFGSGILSLIGLKIKKGNFEQ
jgi:hypothetical protein